MFENPELLSPDEEQALRDWIKEVLWLVELQENGLLMREEYESD
ncbi:MAG: hypothetical protein ACOC41_01785 [Chitinivibrionales bacterium]